MALYIYIYIRLKTGDSGLINGLSNKTKRCTCTYTISGQKYSNKMIFYYIFHVKPHFLKTLLQSRLLF